MIDSGPVQRTHLLFWYFSIVSKSENLRKELKSYTEPQTEKLSTELLCMPFKGWHYNTMRNINKHDTLKIGYRFLSSQCLGQCSILEKKLISSKMLHLVYSEFA